MRKDYDAMYENFEDPFIIMNKAKETKKYLKERNIVFNIKTADEYRIECGTRPIVPKGTKDSKNGTIMTIFEMLDFWEITIVDHRKSQRPDGCWEKKRFNDYLVDLITRQNLYLVTEMNLINVLKCKNYSFHQGDEKSYNYYSKLSSLGADYSSVDGQHRSLATMDFLMNKICIIIDGENKYFDDLQEEEKEFVLYGLIKVNEQEKMLQYQIPAFFRVINECKHLTEEQVRHTEDNSKGEIQVTDELIKLRNNIIYKIVKEFNQKNNKLYFWFTRKQLNNRKDEQFFQKIYLLIQNFINERVETIRENELNYLCIKKQFDKEEKSKKWDPFVNEIKKQIKYILECSRDYYEVEEIFFNSHKNSNGVIDLSVWRCYFVFKYVLKFICNNTIKDEKKLILQFSKEIIGPMLENEVFDKVGYTRGEEVKSKDEKKKIKKQKHRYYISSLMSEHSHSEYLNGLIRLILEQMAKVDFLNKYHGDSIIVLDERRLHTYEEKYIALKGQNYRCLNPNCKCKLDPLKPITYRSHHPKAYSKGGKTNIDNCEIYCVKCHDEKTKKEFIGNKPRHFNEIDLPINSFQEEENNICDLSICENIGKKLLKENNI